MIPDKKGSAESRRQQVQAAIDARRSAVERNRLGQFATPIALAVDIARYVDSLIDPAQKKIRFADPAVGSGSFFSAALDVFGRKRMQSAVGVEIDPAFAEVARTLWSGAGLDVVQGDFTRVIANGSQLPAPNVILANPPYVRHHHLDRADKERLQRLVLETTCVEINGLAGLYVYFLLLATAWMEEGGIAAWLIPSEFMDVNYGAALKRFLTDACSGNGTISGAWTPGACPISGAAPHHPVTLLRAHRFAPDDVQFGDALVSSVVLVFRKTPPLDGHAVEFTLGGTLAEPQAHDLIPLDRLRESRKWTVYPSHANNDRQTLSDDRGPTLGDFFRIQRGIATGCNKFFILERTDAQRRGIPDRFLRPILPSPRHLKTTVIDADADGYPRIDRPLCVIDCDLPEAAIQHEYPELWAYLQTARTLGIRDGYLVRKRNPWYRQEQREPAPFLCTYMGRGSHDKQPFRFIGNRSRAVATNLYLMLHVQGSLAAMLRRYPGRAKAVHALLGQVTGRELRGEGRVYGGGLNKIEPRELARISAASFVERWPELAAAAESV
jgi:adenine-specific DNA-methyltransferase